MRCKLRLVTAVGTLLSVFGLTVADAAIVETMSTNIAPDGGAAHDAYDPAVDAPGSGPMLTASSIDLAQGLTEAGGGISTTGDDNIELTFGVDATTDGSLATVYPENGPGGDAIDHAAYATVGNNDVLTYNLGSYYDLSQIDVYQGWNDSGRDEFSFNLLVSSDGVAFTQIASHAGGPNNTGQITVPITHLISFTDDGGADIATGVQYVQIQGTGADNGYAGLVELDVFGVASVPEPSTILLAGMATLALVAARRR